MSTNQPNGLAMDFSGVLMQRIRHATRSLQSAVVLGIAFGILLPALIVGPVLVQDSHQRELDARVHDLLHQYASILQKTLPDAVWHVDAQTAKSFVDSIMQNPDVVRISVVDASLGQFVVTEHPARRLGMIVKETRTLEWNKQQVGRVTIEMSTAQVEQQFHSNVNKVAATLLLQLLISFLLLLYLFKRRLLRPLMQLREDALRLSQNKLAQPVLPMHNDELGELARAMDQMREKLGSRMEQIRELNALLEQRVTERTGELNQANLELRDALATLKNVQDEVSRSDRLAALGALVAGVAHELNTPIGNSLTVSSTLQDLARRFERSMEAGLTRSSLSKFVQETRYASELLLGNLGNAAELIGSFKQVAVDRTSAKRRSFALDELVAETLLTMAPGFKRSEHVIENAVPPGIRLDGYPGPLGQVLGNLINNARLHGFEHTPNGIIHISARVLDAARVELRVHDNGCGIPEANLGRIFDPFFTTKLGQGGSGLGLNIVYNLVTDVLGGTIQVESTVGSGTCFVLALPLHAPADLTPEPWQNQPPG